MARRTPSKDEPVWTYVDSRIAFDTHITPLALRLYVGLMAGGAYRQPIAVSTREWGERLHVSAESIRAALRSLARRQFIERATQRGARVQWISRAGL